MMLMSLLFGGSQLKEEVRWVMVAGTSRAGLEGFVLVAPALGKQNGREKKGVLHILSGAAMYDPTVSSTP